MNRSIRATIATLILLSVSGTSWSKGAITRIIIEVLYSINSSRRDGYIYLPGPDDGIVLRNTSLIYRGVEGNWFKASQTWETTVKQMLDDARSE